MDTLGRSGSGRDRAPPVHAAETKLAAHLQKGRGAKFVSKAKELISEIQSSDNSEVSCVVCIITKHNLNNTYVCF